MIRGHNFYAAYDPDTHLWVQSERWVKKKIDDEIYKVYNELKGQGLNNVRAKTLKDTRNGQVDYWHKYVQKMLDDSYEILNQTIEFNNSEIKREDYATFKLKYDINHNECPNWDELVGTLYSKEERRKIEYAIGSIVSGESKKIQKFYVLYGDRKSVV